MFDVSLLDSWFLCLSSQWLITIDIHQQKKNLTMRLQFLLLHNLEIMQGLLNPHCERLIVSLQDGLFLKTFKILNKLH